MVDWPVAGAVAVVVFEEPREVCFFVSGGWQTELQAAPDSRGVASFGRNVAWLV